MQNPANFTLIIRDPTQNFENNLEHIAQLSKLFMFFRKVTENLKKFITYS